MITDWGGVMTNPIVDTMNAWIEAEQIDRDSYTTIMRRWVGQAYAEGDEGPIHALERGECPNEEFEQQLASHLLHRDGRPVPADGLLARMFAATALEAAMVDLIRSLRRSGLRTALLSNSWGSNDDYPRHLFPELFDVVVISARWGCGSRSSGSSGTPPRCWGWNRGMRVHRRRSRPTCWPRRPSASWACIIASPAPRRSGCPAWSGGRCREAAVPVCRLPAPPDS